MEQDKKLSSNRNLYRASHTFKIFMVGFILCIAFLRLVFNKLYPNIEIIPDSVLLGIILVIMIYLWIQSAREHAYVLALNRNLETAYEHLKAAELDTISALIKTVEARDPYTCGHSERVTAVAVEIGKALQIDPDVLDLINRSGPLHDIGKIAISDAVLHKKEKLTDEDWAIIKEHPKKGAEILKSLKFLSRETQVILHHHERLDGKGYPHGLKDNEIPLEDRIISVADTFDAMNSARPYREKLTKEYIVEELKRVRGSQLFPPAVDALLTILEKKPDLWAITK